MEMLPKWVLPPTLPSVYDSESFTALEMVAKLYGAVNSLIGEYNKTVEQVTGFQNEEKAAREEFETKITKVIRQFMCDMENYLRENLKETAEQIINEAMNNGTIGIVQNYDPGTEELTLSITGGV